MSLQSPRYHLRSSTFFACLLLVVNGCTGTSTAPQANSTNPPADAARPQPEPNKGEQPTAKGESGTSVVSYYGDEFQGKKTASGERFDKNELTAAHRSLPIGTQVEVENPKNGKKTTVRITDRGPFAKGRQMDVSERAAKELGIDKKGVAKVETRVVEKPGVQSTPGSR